MKEGPEGRDSVMLLSNHLSAAEKWVDLAKQHIQEVRARLESGRHARTEVACAAALAQNSARLLVTELLACRAAEMRLAGLEARADRMVEAVADLQQAFDAAVRKEHEVPDPLPTSLEVARAQALRRAEALEGSSTRSSRKDELDAMQWLLAQLKTFRWTIRYNPQGFPDSASHGPRYLHLTRPTPDDTVSGRLRYFADWCGVAI